MKKQSSSFITWIVLGVVVIIAGVVYYTFFAGPKLPSDTTLTSQPEEEVEAQQVLSLLNQVRKLQVDNSLFQDKSYKSLVDYTVSIPDQNVGRPNPFAPLPGAPLPPSLLAAPQR